jgi:hypothetical protein
MNPIPSVFAEKYNGNEKEVGHFVIATRPVSRND